MTTQVPQFLFLSLLLFVVGCASAPTTLQGPQALPAGEFRLTAASSTSLNTRFISEFDQITSGAQDKIIAAEAGDPMSEEELREVIETASVLTLFMPAFFWEVIGRVGIGYQCELGVRGSNVMAKGEVKCEGPSLGGLKWAGVLGGTMYFGGGVASEVFDLLDSLSLGEHSHYELDATLLVGGSLGDWLEYYGGFKVVAVFVKLDWDIDEEWVEEEIGATTFDETYFQFGGVTGLLVGWKYLFMNLELSALYTPLNAEILGSEVDLSGVNLVPAVGLTAAF